ncbi:MAG: hypothetical protein ABIT36_00250 [Steroidobacteraceae bacterium]
MLGWSDDNRLRRTYTDGRAHPQYLEAPIAISESVSDYGVSYHRQYGFKQDVLLRIQAEAIKAD